MTVHVAVLQTLIDPSAAELASTLPWLPKATPRTG